MLTRITVDDVKRTAELAEAAAADRQRFLAGMRNIELGGQEQERGSRNPTDLDALDIMPDGASPAHEELQRFLAGLTDEQRIELRAVLLVGRGDHAGNQWDDALAQAASPPDVGDFRDIAEKMLLREYLMKGLYALGLLEKEGS